MIWHRKMVIRILLLVAKLIEQDVDVKKDITTLAQHIEVWYPKNEEVK